MRIAFDDDNHQSEADAPDERLQASLAIQNAGQDD
jgi:hypothetical protein